MDQTNQEHKEALAELAAFLSEEKSLALAKATVLEARKNLLIDAAKPNNGLAEIFACVADSLMAVYGFSTVGLQVIDSEAEHLRFFASRGVDLEQGELADAVKQTVPLDRKASVSAKVAITQGSYYASFDLNADLSALPEIDRRVIETLRIVENLTMPLVYDDETMGVLTLSVSNAPIQIDDMMIDEIEETLELISGLFFASLQLHELQRAL